MVNFIVCATIRLVITMAVVALGLVAPDRAVGAQPPPDSISLDILLTNDAHLPAWLLAHAKTEASRIFDKAGIHIVWVTKALGDPPLRVAILARAVHDPKVVLPETMAFTMRQPAVVGGSAYVFVDRVELRAHVGEVPLGLMLGAVMAHEIGHMLIPGAHAPKGLMRASWTENDMRLIMLGALDFAPVEIGIMRQRLWDAQPASSQPTLLTVRSEPDYQQD